MGGVFLGLGIQTPAKDNQQGSHYQHAEHNLQAVAYGCVQGFKIFRFGKVM